jgi:hypothetical protein
MPHPRDEDIYPSHRVTPKVVRAVIKKHDFQFDGKGFQNYRVEIVGEKGLYAAYHSDVKPL